MKENICKSCTYYTANCRCNRLVFSCIGMNDRLASDYKKDNRCDYYKEGESNKNRVIEPMNFFNS